jgi:hypothetical protein
VQASGSLIPTPSRTAPIVQKSAPRRHEITDPRFQAKAEMSTVDERQRVLRLLVKDVLVGPDKITIRHRIPIRERATDNAKPSADADTEDDHAGHCPLRWGRGGRPGGEPGGCRAPRRWLDHRCLRRWRPGGRPGRHAWYARYARHADGRHGRAQLRQWASIRIPAHDNPASTGSRITERRILRATRFRMVLACC